MHTEHTAIHMDFVDDDVAEVLKEGGPTSFAMIAQDQAQHLGVDGKNVWTRCCNRIPLLAAHPSL